MQEADQLTPQGAAAAIQAAEGWDHALRARTTGIMWMLWAFIAAAVFMTYALTGALHRQMPPWMGLVWAAWSLPGLLTTFLLWRSVGFVMPRGPPAMRTFALYAGTFLALTIGGVITAMALHLPLLPPAVVLFGLGAATALIGVRRLRVDRSALAVVVVGLAFMGVAAWEATWPYEDSMEGVHQAALLNSPIAGLGLLWVGLTFYFRR